MIRKLALPTALIVLWLSFYVVALASVIKEVYAANGESESTQSGAVSEAKNAKLLVDELKAAPKNSDKKSGISVTPSIIKVDLSKTSDATIYYENNTKSNVEIKFSASDFSEMDDGWKVKFLDQKESQNYKYSLASWIKFDRETISLGPSETAQVKVFFEKDRLTQGGHYASILATVTPLTDEEKAPVTIKSVLATLVFVSGGSASSNEAGEISVFSPKRGGSYLFPESYALRFKNTGNVQLSPHGVVEIRDIFGELVGKGILNEGSLFVLPETIRGFDIKIINLRAFISPSVYTAKLTLRYGENGDKFIERTDKFFTFGSSSPAQLGISILALLGVLVILYKIVERRLKQNK